MNSDSDFSVSLPLPQKNKNKNPFSLVTWLITIRIILWQSQVKVLMGFYRFCCMQSKALNSGNIISTVKLANGPNEVGKSDLEFILASNRASAKS